MQPTNIAPAPWSLTGRAFVLIYHFSKAFCQKYGFLNAYQARSLKGFVGAVMLVDYTSSEIGPYQELLFMPGLCGINGRLTFSISKIYVSTYDSVWNGQNNWGIPKELADFSIVDNPDGSTTFDVAMHDRVFFHAKLQGGGFSFPVSSRVLPFFNITQQFANQRFRTRPRLSGRAEFSFVRNLVSRPEYFPPIHQLNPLAVLHLKDFKMKFPIPKIITKGIDSTLALG